MTTSNLQSGPKKAALSLAPWPLWTAASACHSARTLVAVGIAVLSAAGGGESLAQQAPVSSGVTLWFNANDMNNDGVPDTTANGTAVTSWADLSGNGFNATNTDSLLYQTGTNGVGNNQAAVLFNGGYFRTSAGGQSLTADATVFSVFKEPSTPTTSFLAIWGNEATGQRRGMLDHRDPSSYWGFGFNGYNADAPWGGVRPPANSSNIGVFALKTNGYPGLGNLDLGLNGTGTTKNTSANLNSFSNAYVTLGANQATTGGERFTGLISEVLIYNRKLGSAEVNIVNNSLSAKYDVALAAAADFYSGDTGVKGNYDFNVVGIGRQSDGGLSTSSSSLGLILGELNGSLANGEYLLAGQKTAVNAWVGSDLPSDLGERWSRSWYVDKTGGIDASMAFDFSDAGISFNSGKAYRLVFRSSDSASFSLLSSTYSVQNTDQVKFDLNNASLSSGYYTIAVVPEPGTVALMGVGVATCVVGVRMRRRRRIALP